MDGGGMDGGSRVEILRNRVINNNCVQSRVRTQNALEELHRLKWKTCHK